MAFDAGMLAAVISEIREKALGARIEKVFQPGKEEIILQMRAFEGGKRLMINVASGNSRIGFSEHSMENPQNPPMFCMLLRKHLNGAKLTGIRQPGFERVAILEFETRDEMGFPCTRSLVAEIMGKYSNLIFVDENMKILSALKIVDFTTSSLRQVLPGMKYELPPAQDKTNPLDVTEEKFASMTDTASGDLRADKFISNGFLGISAALAREIVFRATRFTDTPLEYCDRERLWKSFSEIFDNIKNNRFSPCIVCDPENSDKPVEYCFTELTQYGSKMKLKMFESASEMLDVCFESRDRETRVHQRAADILKLLTNAETRLHKKIELQKGELAECEKGAEYKRMGDLIVSNIYLLERGMKSAQITDYSTYDENTGSYPVVTVTLDERLSPSANAQRYFKKYNKSKVAKTELAKQIAIAESELEYIYTVFDALTRAETVSDLAEIREELYHSGYASKMRTYTSHKQSAPSVTKYRTSGGYTVLCGRNNMQNEYITHKAADKNDYWFHVKNAPGSHVVMLCGGEEPSERDFTEAAEIAAYNSKVEASEKTAVDYTKIRFIKKPPASKPGYVIYHTYWTAYVTPDKEKIESLRLPSGKI